MQPVILTLNSGSSSLKFSLFSISDHQLKRILYGQVEALDVQLKFSVKNDKGLVLIEQLVSAKEKIKLEPQADALNILLSWLKKQNSDYTLVAAGHRIVHGGERFIAPLAINPRVLNQLEALIPLAPLHQPYNIAGIKALTEFIPGLFQIACFDTGFHSTQPEVAQAYALPDGLSQLPLKRYGFHGLSYEYISQVAPRYLGAEQAEAKVIIAHLGHGASMCAMQNRRSIATTMGFTALDGLPMGTRCGNIDPGIILYLLQNGMSTAEITELLYQQSGLLGISKISSDIRLLLSSAEPLAKKAIDIFVYRIRRELGSLIAALGGLNCLIFTAGIGEHSPEIRARTCEQADWLPIILDGYANQESSLKISQDKSKVSVWVIPTNEEVIIAQHTLYLWKHHQGYRNY